MALRSTVFKATLQVSDLDRGYFGEHALTLARHPSETDERMMVRLLAFALYAADDLRFGRGLSSEDEPDLARSDLTGAISLWIEVGLPDEKWIRKACQRAGQVVVVSYGRTAGHWWEGVRERARRLSQLAVLHLEPQATAQLAAMAGHGMRLQVTIQDRLVWVSDAERNLSLEPTYWQEAAT